MALWIMSYNVKGLNSIQKRWIALKEFRSSGADVVIIQEKHFRAGGSLKFASKFFPVSYLASDSTGKAGVAILIKKSFLIRVKNSYANPHGSFLVYMSSSFTLVNVYSQIDFLNKVFDSPRYHSQPIMIVGGDLGITTWSCLLLELDRPSPGIPPPGGISLKLTPFISALDLTNCLTLGGSSFIPLKNTL